MKAVKYYLCRFLGWHEPTGIDIIGWTQEKSICKWCHKSILKDSQGNWF